MKSPLLYQVFLMWLFTQTWDEVFASERRNMNFYSCQPSCSKLRRAKTLYGADCYCSESCMTYGDCCRDAPYKNTDNEPLPRTCITLSGLGPVSLVSTCPLSSDVRSGALFTGSEVIFPVTSEDTGTSYVNYFYAWCNKDVSNLVGWPVLQRCGEKGRKTKREISFKNFMHHMSNNNYLRPLPEKKYDSKLLCDSKLYADNNDVDFARSLEIRKCVRPEISRCPSDWHNQTTRQLCSSFLDPMRTLVRVYRNGHCAQCNGEKSWIPVCVAIPTTKAKDHCKPLPIPRPSQCKVENKNLEKVKNGRKNYL